MASSSEFSYRITWINGKPHVQRCPKRIVIERSPSRDWSRPGSFAHDGEIVRAATDDDLKAMHEGRLSFDSETEPGRVAWAAHVAAGGD